MPTLTVDENARATGWRPTADHLIERRLVWALLHSMQAAYPERTLIVFDGEENIVCHDAEAAMNVIFNLDNAWIRLGRAWVYLVLGNGADCISDYGYTPATEAAVNSAEESCGLR